MDAAAVATTAPHANPVLTHADKRVLLWLIAFSFFMQMLDSTIVNTATPTIAAGMGIAPLDLRTALTSYTLALAVFIPLSSWLSDRYGTRAVFWWAILIFTLGSLACGLAQNLWMLVAARIVQGFGGAMMIPVGRLALVRAFDKSEFVDAMAFATIPGLIGPAIGPCCFETDADVPRALRDALGRAAEPYITRRGQKWHVDLKGVNARWLEKAGVTQIDVCPDCTACRPDLYWSHRRMGQARGAQIAMICL